MKHVVKKSMMVAGVLACLFASTAFAKITPSAEQDKATQAAALKENKDYDATHGYKNESVKQMKEEAAEKKVEAAAKKEEQVKAEKNAAWERDKATQAAALKENKDYDAAHGYAK